MKFTRSLALAALATVAMSMTACDDSTSPNVPEGFNFDSFVKLGAQGAVEPSFASLRLKDSVGALVRYTGVNTADVNYYGKHLDKVDMIFFADSANSNRPSFISPKTYKTDYGRLAAATSVNQLNSTEFLWVGNSEATSSEERGPDPLYTQITAEDVADYADNAGYLDLVEVAKGDNFIAKIKPAGSTATYLAVIRVEEIANSGRSAVLDVKVKAKM